MQPLDILKMILPEKPPTCAVVIAAAGSSLRCRGEDKLLHKINNKPVLAHTAEVFERCPSVSEIIVVTRAQQLEQIASICREYGLKKVSKIIAGGDTRTQSVFNGVFSVSKKAKYIAIHDGARPCIDIETIEQTLKTAVTYHACAPGVPVVSTVKRTGGFGAGSRDRIILETVDRDDLVEIQTPQIFKAEIIKAALTNAIDKDIRLTDDCMAVELIGMPVHITHGSRRNIKITQTDDFKIAEIFLSGREDNKP